MNCAPHLGQLKRQAVCLGGGPGGSVGPQGGALKAVTLFGAIPVSTNYLKFEGFQRV